MGVTMIVKLSASWILAALVFWAGPAAADDCAKVKLDELRPSAPIGVQPKIKNLGALPLIRRRRHVAIRSRPSSREPSGRGPERAKSCQKNARSRMRHGSGCPARFSASSLITIACGARRRLDQGASRSVAKVVMTVQPVVDPVAPARRRPPLKLANCNASFLLSISRARPLVSNGNTST